MPSHLRVACLAYIGGLGGMMSLMPFYEVGVWRLVAPLLALSFLAAPVLLMLRWPKAWPYMSAVAIAGVAINSLFFPTTHYYGPYTAAAQVFAAIQMLASAVILWSLRRHPASRAWFERRDA